MYEYFPVYMYVYACAWCLWKTEEGIRDPRTGIVDGCEPCFRCYELNPGSSTREASVLNYKPSF